jgi:hypothetical protein
MFNSTFGKEPEPVTLEPLPAFLQVMGGYLVIEERFGLGV